MNDQTYLTKEGFDKLQQELSELVHTRRREIAARIQEAKELGDLSENAEYQEAKNEQAFNEGRIEEIENILRHAQIIEEGASTKGAIDVGMTVEVKSGPKPMTVQIVGSNEADPTSGLISNASPLGSALLGRRVGDRITVKTPKGDSEFEIVSIR